MGPHLILLGKQWTLWECVFPKYILALKILILQKGNECGIPPKEIFSQNLND